MRGQRNGYVLAAVLAALVVAAGCGDSNDTNIILTNGPTATAGGPTPARTATPVVTATPAVTPTSAATGGNPTATASPSGSVNADAQSVVSDVVPFLTLGAPLATGVSSSALSARSTTKSAEAEKVDNCPDGGTRTDDQGLLVRNITLDTCDVSAPQLGSFEFDGTITITFTAGTIDFDVTATDLANDNSVDFVGTLNGTVQQSGGFVLNGVVTVSTLDGDFTLTMNAITVDANHHLVSGSATATDNDDNFDIASLAMTVNSGGATANVVATFDDNSTANYVLNLSTGQLTPTS
jgi:hypothetical protein